MPHIWCCGRLNGAHTDLNVRNEWMEAETLKCDNEACGRDFTVQDKTQRFCCSRCRSQYHNTERRRLMEIGAAVRQTVEDHR